MRNSSTRLVSPHYAIPFIVAKLTRLIPLKEVITMNHRINSRHLPLFIERLAEEGYTVNIEHCKKLIRITCEGSSLRNIVPFGQTRLTEFGG